MTAPEDRWPEVAADIRDAHRGGLGDAEERVLRVAADYLDACAEDRRISLAEGRDPAPHPFAHRFERAWTGEKR